MQQQPEIPPTKTKSAATEVTAQKTQTPIVAKPIQYKGQ